MARIPFLSVMSILVATACAGQGAPAPGPQTAPATTASTSPAAAVTGPIIDMHLHGEPVAGYGPLDSKFCMEMLTFVPTWDPKEGPWPAKYTVWQRDPGCENPIPGAANDEALMAETLAEMERLDIVGVISGDSKTVATWKAASPERVIAGRHFNIRRDAAVTPQDLARAFKAGEFTVLAEVTNQYSGVAPNHPDFEPYWQVAEDNDIPVGIHVGSMPPGIPYLMPGARVAAGNPLLLEEVLIKHPRLRVYVMHAGYPFLDDIVALMQIYPQLYVGTGVLQAVLSEASYNTFIKALVDAGLGKRIMYGTDQMKWPGMIAPSIERVKNAPLTTEQKRDILYNNAARFLRLEPR